FVEVAPHVCGERRADDRGDEEVPVLEEDVVVLDPQRPCSPRALREHPLEPAADVASVRITMTVPGDERDEPHRIEHVEPTTFHEAPSTRGVDQEGLCPQVAEAAVDRREPAVAMVKPHAGEEKADVIVVVGAHAVNQAPDADQPVRVPWELPVAADLPATGEAIVGYLAVLDAVEPEFCFSSRPADVAADIAAGPWIDWCGRRRRCFHRQ